VNLHQIQKRREKPTKGKEGRDLSARFEENVDDSFVATHDGDVERSAIPHIPLLDVIVSLHNITTQISKLYNLYMIRSGREERRRTREMRATRALTLPLSTRIQKSMERSTTVSAVTSLMMAGSLARSTASLP